MSWKCEKVDKVEVKGYIIRGSKVSWYFLRGVKSFVRICSLFMEISVVMVVRGNFFSF